MITILDELYQQPQALRDMIGHYRVGGGAALRALGPRPALPIFTGLGASYHAAWIAALHLQHLGFPALCIETSDLVNYATALIGDRSTVVCISQSGSSGEVAELAGRMPASARLIAITNHPASELGRTAAVTLPLVAGAETLIASKTLTNTLALVWLLVRQWGGASAGLDLETLRMLAARVEALLADSRGADRLLQTLDPDRGLMIVGHGPHAATARHAAMMLAEWPKVPSQSFGLAAFRHGFIEAVRPDVGVIALATGSQRASVERLGGELTDYGARVLLMDAGEVRGVGEAGPASPTLDEFLAPVLDIITLQHLAVRLAEERGVEPGFRHISKIVRAR
ncbi:MAG TPA: SIS domain-containing protein [Thermoflexales bacterium]|nr:SIS domain-containing protein [Thermoflexales bacterium]HQY24714.1 SIS domain-containing protein [Thermoflexales bacterium]